MTKAAHPKEKAPPRYRYIGVEDIKISGRDIHHGHIIEGEDHFAHDKRFEKVKGDEESGE